MSLETGPVSGRTPFGLELAVENTSAAYSHRCNLRGRL